MEKENEINPALNMGGVKHKIVKTYAEDMAKVIEDSQGSVIKKIIHGEEEHEALKKNLSPESRKNKFFMFFSLLLILFSSATLYFFYFNEKANTVPVEQQFTPLIFNDASVFIEVKGLNKNQIAQIVLNEVNTAKVKNGGVEGIYLTEDKKIIGLRRFLTLIQSNFIPGDDSLLMSDNFLLGAVNNENRDFFILLKMRSIADVFDSLRAWENKMFSDWRGFFGINISPETKYLLTAEFQNGIMENKNARILYKENNQPDNGIAMMYILADDNSVIIADTQNAAREIMSRLAGSRVKK